MNPDQLADLTAYVNRRTVEVAAGIDAE